ncbi:MAG TPA: M48 family metallopeptidase [Burkholderiales bacterium]|nr:M48 family metallopeptidase [Burkholderiales bacterium]
MHAFGIVFLAALALATVTRLWLAARHLAYVRAHRRSVPAEFASEVGLEAHQKAADYTCAKTRLALLEVITDAVILLALTFGGVLQWLHNVSAAGLADGIGRGLLLLALVGALMTLLDLPFGLYRTFVIEQRFGFNKMTPAMYFLDFAKAMLLALVFGLPLAAVVLWLMATAGDYWWLYAWLTWVGFNVFTIAIYPTWIAPLFNKFSPMHDAELKERVERLLARCGFKVKGLMVMDGSRRSTHGNAYFTGFGASKRIVFFDTLLARLNPGEVEAVLAHELGHFRLRHVVKRMAWMAAASLGFLWLLGWLMQQPWFFHALNVQSPSTAMALVLFAIVLPQFTFLLQPIGAMVSRRHEFEADEYATRHASARDLASALIKLYRENASTLTPDPLHSAFYDSHPPAIARIARLQKT